MRNQNQRTNPKTIRRYERLAAEKAELDKKVGILRGMGYSVFLSLKAGTNSTWGCALNGDKSALGFDSETEGWQFLSRLNAAEIDRLQATDKTEKYAPISKIRKRAFPCFRAYSKRLRYLMYNCNI